MVTFNLSKPADVISFEEITDGQQPENTTKKIWEVGDKKFVPTTLLKNVIEGSVSFNGSGILAYLLLEINTLVPLLLMIPLFATTIAVVINSFFGKNTE